MTARGKVESFVVRKRRASLREEFTEQVRLVEMLARYLPPGSFSTSLENRPRSLIGGILQRQRGVRSGLPDVHVLYRGKPIWLELKSHRGVASTAQKQVCAELKAAGADWYMVRFWRAGMMALHLSGVVFRRRLRLRKLKPWEGPFTDPNQRLPQAPEVAAQRRAAQRAYRERQRARKAAKLAAAHDDAAGGDIAA